MPRLFPHPFKFCGSFLLPLLASVACSSSALPEGEGGEDADPTHIEAGGDTGPSKDVSPSKPDRVVPPIDPTAPKTVVDFIKEVNKRFCVVLQSCKTPLFASVTAEVCEQTFNEFKGTPGALYLFAPTSSLKAENINYYPNTASDCLKKFDSVFKVGECQLPAAQISNVRAVCIAATRGKLKRNIPCSSTMECESGTYCGEDGNSICLPHLGDGEACQSGRMCSNRGLGSRICVFSDPLASGTRSGVCQKGILGADCQYDTDCANQYVCNEKKCASGKDFSKDFK